MTTWGLANFTRQNGREQNAAYQILLKNSMRSEPRGRNSLSANDFGR